MLNIISIMGRLTRDPELRYTANQTPVASFTLAVDRDLPNRDGQRETDFIDCVAWKSGAEFVSKHFHKGDLAAVTGRLQIKTWEDNTGTKRRNAEVITNSVYFGSTKSAQHSSESTFQERGDEDGELPF